jgi:capsular exopolysaccharide synthesis family protein
MELEDDVQAARVIAVPSVQRLDARRPGPTLILPPKMVAHTQPAGAGAEAFRALYYGLRRALGGAPLGVLGVLSAARGEGRSTVAANLALTAARESGLPTALVDCDLREPGLHAFVGAEGELGLSDVLANRADLEAAVIECPGTGVALLPGGRPDPEPARRFTTPRFARVLAQLRNRFDEVIVDLPPLAFVDSRLIGPQCSGLLFVVRSGVTDAAVARELLDGLEGVKLLGATLNDASENDAPALASARKALPGGRKALTGSR